MNELCLSGWAWLQFTDGISLLKKQDVVTATKYWHGEPFAEKLALWF